MIGPAEIEDMRLDLLAVEEQARLYDAALHPLNRHWSHRGATSVGSVTRICDLVFARSADRPLADWKAVASEAVVEAGFGISWDGDEVASLEAVTDPGSADPGSCNPGPCNPGHEHRADRVSTPA